MGEEIMPGVQMAPDHAKEQQGVAFLSGILVGFLGGLILGILLVGIVLVVALR